MARDTISRGKVSPVELETIIDRLYNTHTKSSSGGKVCKEKPGTATNIIARRNIANDEVDEIYKRLASTHTKSSSGGDGVGPYEHPKTPGLGQKSLPVIEGLETRFQGNKVPRAKEDEVIARLHS